MLPSYEAQEVPVLRSTPGEKRQLHGAEVQRMGSRLTPLGPPRSHRLFVLPA